MTASNVRGDRRALQSTMEAILSESRRPVAQKQLPGLDRPLLASGREDQKQLPDRIAEFVFNIPARRRLSELVLSQEVVTEIRDFLYEFSHAALLRANSLEPRHTILLVGPPGNGKTTLAEVLATELALPLLSLRYDTIVDSFLGETSNRLRKVTEYAALNPCVLFFDEFDAVGKERGDAQETGEIKRVASSLLMQMDRLPSHSLIVCATNHPELLDRAVWRRFEIKLQIDRPGSQELATWFTRFEASLNSGSIGITADEFAEYMAGQNMSDVEAFTLDVRRKMVLSKGKLTAAEAVQEVLARLKKTLANTLKIKNDRQQLPNRSIKKGIAKGKKDKGEETSLP